MKFYRPSEKQAASFIWTKWDIKCPHCEEERLKRHGFIWTKWDIKNEFGQALQKAKQVLSELSGI